jgi:uncharacterized protein (TIGR00288 family)
MNSTETRTTRIAVFIDFDNVEIGVKNTIGGPLDIGVILESIKERGEIVTKIAYSDWKRAGDYSRLLTQHAIRMVQRNMTPGGDKNGADITMALDALEMCFTHDHINAFVIVGGDSDFISLVEKLKQYGRKVIVVGGRQFTSQTMQRNCHEFIAYENLVSPRGGGRSSDRGGRPVAGGGSDINKAIPLVRRALKVLTERELSPQLGLLKSTLLQLDSTFSEREYGAGSFRDFMEKVAKTGAVTLKEAGRSMLVEDANGGPALDDSAPAAEMRPDVPPSGDAQPAMERVDTDDDDAMPASTMTAQEGIQAVQQAFAQATQPIRWPMYVRQAKQFLRGAVAGFDERRYGFASVVDLLRAAGREGVFRVERDRQGAIRLFPGAGLQGTASVTSGLPVDTEAETEAEGTVALDENVDVSVPAENVAEVVEAVAVEETVTDSPILDAELEEPEDDQLKVLAAAEAKAKAKSERGGGRGGRGVRTPRPIGVMTSGRRTREPREPRAAVKPRGRKTPKS